MPAYKLVLDEVFEESYKLIAIHCSVEEYKLAFLLNKYLNLKLARSRKDIDFQIEGMRILFALYTYEDQLKYCTFSLVSNVSKAEFKSNANSNSLFGIKETTFKKSYLLPEFKKVDFFLKIEEEIEGVSEKLLLEKIKEIPQVSLAYSIEAHQIKSKENLIFD
ncbi:IPExxxVDY family protein [Salinimicrobium gaetbulicola]|uniref:IPExxxVDY family protein n=1 Tax=Salinimicrobium gaetbulicola TaxID=999702 RepID=A0ABW3IGV6_9FLAO